MPPSTSRRGTNLKSINTLLLLPNTPKLVNSATIQIHLYTPLWSIPALLPILVNKANPAKPLIMRLLPPALKDTADGGVASGLIRFDSGILS